MQEGLARVEDLRIDPPTKERQHSYWVWLFAIAAVTLLGATGWWFTFGRASNTPERVAGPVAVAEVESAAPQAAAAFTAGGYLEVVPPGPVIVSAMVEGRIEAIHVVEGQPVERGQELARIDASLHRYEVSVRGSAVELARAKLARLEAGFRSEEVEQAKADWAQAQAEAEAAELDLERLLVLVRTDATTRKEYDDARFAAAAARAEVASREAGYNLRRSGTRPEDIAIARAELYAAEAELDRAKWKLDHCVIRAPQAGVVFEQFASVGDWIAPGDGRDRSSAILSLVDPTRIQAWVDVNQRDISRVLIGQEATLTTDASPNRPLKGEVVKLLPKANLQKNTVQVKVAITDPPDDLRPEMSVKVTFLSADAAPEEKATTR